MKPRKTAKAEECSARVVEAPGRDAGRGFARVDPEVLAVLGARVGDVLELEGKRATSCRAMPSFPEQRGQGAVQLDRASRQNAGAAVGDRVTLRRLEVPAAGRIELVASDGSVPTLSPHQLDGLALRAGDLVHIPLFGSRISQLEVRRTEPEGPVLLTPSTRVRFTGARRESAGRDAGAVSYEDIGGLEREIQRVRELVELPLKHPGLFTCLGIEPPRGVLLVGPPGTGKTLIAKAVAGETQAAFFSVSGPEIIHKFYGESEARLREIFEAASKAAPAIVFLDELDSVAPRRERVQGDVEKRVVAQLLALMDGLQGRGQVVVIGATNLPDALDPALRRPGRFDRELVIGVPDLGARQAILEIHTRGMPLAGDVGLPELARQTPGFVGADLAALCREAAMVTLRRLVPDLDLDAGLSAEQMSELKVDRTAFQDALREVGPSAVRELVVEIPRVGWDDVGGLHEAKTAIRRAIEWPLAYPELFRQARCRPPRGILLVGEPGTGKTLLARATAGVTGCNFLSVKGPELLSRFVGDSEKAVRDLFRKARQSAPCVVFLDEIDSLAPARVGGVADSGVSGRAVAQILTEMDGIEELSRVLVLAATNRIDLLDAALLRPGRFDLVVHLGRPELPDCEQILRIHTRGRPLSEDVDLAALARHAVGLAPADLAWACDQAALTAISEMLALQGAPPEPDRLRLEARHLREALRQGMDRRLGKNKAPRSDTP